MENGKIVEALTGHVQYGVGIGVDPGWLFVPDDQVLISVYLSKKNNQNSCTYPMIPSTSVYDYDPILLVGRGCAYFFHKELSSNSSSGNIKGGSGSWIRGSKVCVKDRNNIVIGFRQNYRFKPHDEVKDGDWLMSLYREVKEASTFVLLKVYLQGKTFSEISSGSIYFQEIRKSMLNGLPMILSDTQSQDTSSTGRLGVDIGLDPGWVFAPSDDALINVYLRSKLQVASYSYPMIPDMDIYQNTPSVLVGQGGGYFFNPRTPLSSASNRVDRATPDGRWKKSSKKEIINAGGIKRSLKCKPSVDIKGVGDWLMSEYQIQEVSVTVLSKIYCKGKRASDIDENSAYLCAVKAAMLCYSVFPFQPLKKVEEEEAVSALIRKYTIDDVSVTWLFEDQTTSYDASVDIGEPPMLLENVLVENEEEDAAALSYLNETE